MYRCHRLALLASLCAAACGSVENKAGHLPDAGTPTDDAPPTGPVRGTVHVTVLDPAGTGAPAVGANVVFIDPDGTIVKKAATDTTGKSEADVLPGANVTSITVNGGYRMITIYAIAPGDDLIMGNTSSDNASAGTFTVSYPANKDATQYGVATPCGSMYTSLGNPATSMTFNVINSCKVDPMEIVVIALNANGPFATISKKGVAFTPNGSDTITGAYKALTNFTATYSNISSSLTSFQLTRSVPDAFGISDFASATTPVAASQSFTVSAATGTNARITTTAGIQTKLAQQQLIQFIPGTAATYNMNVGNTLMPWLNPASFDPATQKLTMSTDSTGTTTDKPDLVQVSLAYTRSDAAGNNTPYSWTIFTAEPAELVLPAVPADVADIMPLATDSIGTPRVQTIEVDTVPNYAAVRNDPASAFITYYSNSTRPSAATIRKQLVPARQ